MSAGAAFRAIALREMGLGPRWRHMGNRPVVLDGDAGNSETERVHRIELLDAESLIDDIAQCTACARASAQPRVISIGPTTARCVVVTDELGGRHAAEGTPLIGEVARLTASILRALGLAVESVQIIPLVKCAAAHAIPLSDEIDRCKAYLDRQLALAEPEIVIALGARCAEIVAPGVGVSKPGSGTERVFKIGTREVRLMTVPHPRDALADWQLKKTIWQTLGSLASAQ